MVEDGEEMRAWQAPTGNVKDQNLPKNTKKSLLTVASAPVLRLFLLRRFLQIGFVQSGGIFERSNVLSFLFQPL